MNHLINDASEKLAKAERRAALPRERQHDAPFDDGCRADRLAKGVKGSSNMNEPHELIVSGSQYPNATQYTLRLLRSGVRGQQSPNVGKTTKISHVRHDRNVKIVTSSHNILCVQQCCQGRQEPSSRFTAPPKLRAHIPRFLTSPKICRNVEENKKIKWRMPTAGCHKVASSKSQLPRQPAWFLGCGQSQCCRSPSWHRLLPASKQPGKCNTRAGVG